MAYSRSVELGAPESVLGVRIFDVRSAFISVEDVTSEGEDPTLRYRLRVPTTVLADLSALLEFPIGTLRGRGMHALRTNGTFRPVHPDMALHELFIFSSPQDVEFYTPRVFCDAGDVRTYPTASLGSTSVCFLTTHGTVYLCNVQELGGGFPARWGYPPSLGNSWEEVASFLEKHEGTIIFSGLYAYTEEIPVELGDGVSVRFGSLFAGDDRVHPPPGHRFVSLSKDSPLLPCYFGRDLLLMNSYDLVADWGKGYLNRKVETWNIPLTLPEGTEAQKEREIEVNVVQSIGESAWRLRRHLDSIVRVLNQPLVMESLSQVPEMLFCTSCNVAHEALGAEKLKGYMDLDPQRRLLAGQRYQSSCLALLVLLSFCYGDGVAFVSTITGLHLSCGITAGAYLRAHAAHHAGKALERVLTGTCSQHRFQQVLALILAASKSSPGDGLSRIHRLLAKPGSVLQKVLPKHVRDCMLCKPMVSDSLGSLEKCLRRADWARATFDWIDKCSALAGACSPGAVFVPRIITLLRMFLVLPSYSAISLLGLQVDEKTGLTLMGLLTGLGYANEYRNQATVHLGASIDPVIRRQRSVFLAFFHPFMRIVRRITGETEEHHRFLRILFDDGEKDGSDDGRLSMASSQQRALFRQGMAQFFGEGLSLTLQGEEKLSGKVRIGLGEGFEDLPSDFQIALRNCLEDMRKADYLSPEEAERDKADLHEVRGAQTAEDDDESMLLTMLI